MKLTLDQIKTIAVGALKELEAMCEKYHCYLPPFCHFTPEEWQTIGHEYDEVRDCMLGWDITDYGMNDFDKFGFSLITIRNGNRAMEDKYPKVYAEKLLYLKEGQYAPNHFHWYKTEDIINRGGGNVLIRVYNSLENEEIDYESDVTVHTDGRTYTVPAGTQIRLTPGESIHVQQFLYHDFAVEEGTGPVLLGEVSQCNDDNTELIPVKKDQAILFLGDSITQGYSAKFSSLTYSNTITRFYDANCLNQAIGGNVFNEEDLDEFLEFQPDTIFVAFGTNDWKQAVDVSTNAECYFEKLNRIYPNVPINVILPIWRGDIEELEKTTPHRFMEVREIIREKAERYTNAKVIDSIDFLPHCEGVFEDQRLHPNDIGFIMYAEGILKALE